MRTNAPWYVSALLLVVSLFGCGGGGGATPAPDPCAGVLPECTSDAQCANGATCSACGVCEGGAPGCTRHTDCAENERCDGGVCTPGGCTAESCGASWCNPDTRACEAFDCSKAGCENGLRCDAESGACVECSVNSHCVDTSAPYCDLPTRTCVNCRGDGDCEDSPAGPLCRMADYQCVTCLDDDGCSGATPRCDPAGACVQCVEDADCPGSRCQDDGTCWPGPQEGEICRDDGSCAAGLVCMADGNVCRRACDPYDPDCGNGTVCVMLESGGELVLEGGTPVAACLPGTGGIANGRACTGEDTCRADLFCMPSTRTTSFCRAFCDPAGPNTCGGDHVCTPVPYGGTTVGVCGPLTRWMQTCASDDDCAFDQGCRPMSASDGGFAQRCDWSPGSTRSAEACDDDADCRSGSCVAIDDSGNGYCFGACDAETDCKSTAFCAPLAIAGSTAPVQACQPRCTNDAACAAFGTSAVCSLVADGLELVPGCTRALGPVAGGGDCTADAQCATGTCFDNSVGAVPATAGYCLGTCGTNADCANATVCRTVAFKTSPPRAEPAWDTAQVCWGGSCTGPSQCPEGRTCLLEPDPANPASAQRLSCGLAVGAEIGGSPCSSANECASGSCITPAWQSFSSVKENCTNGFNDDWWQDSLVDCADPDCADVAPCLAGGENCSDGIDNDGDSLVDCGDPNCADTDACAELCGDGVDNDGDGDVDCADAECAYRWDTNCNSRMCFGPCGSNDDCGPFTTCTQTELSNGTTVQACQPY